MEKDYTAKSCCIAAAEHFIAGALMFLAGTGVFHWDPGIVAIGAILIGLVKCWRQEDRGDPQDPQVGLFVLLVFGVALAAELGAKGWLPAWLT